MIEKVINAMSDKDYEALSSCFTEDCEFIDYCPSQHGNSDSYLYGSDCVEMFFRSRWAAGIPVIAEPVIESENRASIFISYGGAYIYARISIEEIGSGGLIKKAIVHPV